MNAGQPTPRRGQEGPVLRVVHGDPTPKEVAAIVAVLSARARAAEAARTRTSPKRVSAWRDPARLLRPPPRPGPAAWRASAWPP